MFEQELAFFESKRDEFCKIYPGQFVLIHKDQLLGSFTTEAQAYEAGIQKLGNIPFLIKCALPTDLEVSVPAYTIGLLSA